VLEAARNAAQTAAHSGEPEVNQYLECALWPTPSHPRLRRRGRHVVPSRRDLPAEGTTCGDDPGSDPADATTTTSEPTG